MANYTRQQRMVTYTEYLIPKGDCMGEFYKASHTAWNDYLNQRALPADSRMPDDWAWVDFDDEHIIIRVTTEEVTPA